MPDTFPVEFLGGPADGETVVFPEKPKPFMSPVTIRVDDQNRPIPGEYPAPLYHFKSFDPDKNLWLYEYDGMLR